MTSAGSVGGDDRIRLFLALQLPEATLDVVGRWQAEQILAGRPVAREHLHVTLAFLGGRPARELPSIFDALRDAMSKSGVAKAYALQAGREIRVIVEPTEVNDEGTALLSYEIARQIEDQLEYPGQVKVIVIRESRAIEVAK